MHFKNVSKKTPVFLYSQILFSPYVRESVKVLYSGSRPLDSGFQLSGFRNRYHSGFQIPNIVDSGFQSSGFRIPTAKICWIPDSGFSYMGRLFHEWSLAWSLLCTPFAFIKSLLMSAQLGGLTKSLATLFALKRLFTGVSTNVVI